MASARGTLFLNTVAFVRQAYGEAAHARVLGALTREQAATFSTTMRDGSWHPVELLAAYMETAQSLLAPEDPDFFRRVGVDSARRDRAGRGVGVMVADIDTAVRLAAVLWRTYFQGGALDLLETDGHGVTLHVRDFPARRALCQRMVGGLEALLGTAASDLSVTERACTTLGAPYCEIRVSWETPRPDDPQR